MALAKRRTSIKRGALLDLSHSWIFAFGVYLEKIIKSFPICGQPPKKGFVKTNCCAYLV
jgi:hypothetical protein